MPGVKQHSITPLFKKLKEKCLIFSFGDTRKGDSGCKQLVLRHNKYADKLNLHLTPPKKKKTQFQKGYSHAMSIVGVAVDLEDAKHLLCVEAKNNVYKD